MYSKKKKLRQKIRFFFGVWSQQYICKEWILMFLFNACVELIHENAILLCPSLCVAAVHCRPHSYGAVQAVGHRQAMLPEYHDEDRPPEAEGIHGLP